MKLNIFQIPKEDVAPLLEKFTSVGLRRIHHEKKKEWDTHFFFSKNAQPIPIPWIATYSDFFPDPKPENKMFYGAYLWIKDEVCLVISYGKTHFYLRQFCDHDFGTEIAKRIADQDDTRQKSSKKFAGRKKKEIKSYAKNSHLDIESGESVDYLQAAVIKDYKDTFGVSGKFGSSVLLSPDIEKDELPGFLDDLILVLEKPELFKLPRTTVLSASSATKSYENKLIRDIRAENAEFELNHHELVGTDFVFTGQEKYSYSYHGRNSDVFDLLLMRDVNAFVDAYSIPNEEILNIKVHVSREDARSYAKPLREAIDYVVDEKNVLLTRGTWMHFNEDYIDQLDEYIDAIDIEEVEDRFRVVTNSEGDFNKSLESHGFEVADKNFSKIKVKSGTQIEAWDLKKGDCVYAVKRGTTQDFGYVLDQASNTLILINKKANIKKLDSNFKSYCVWLIFKRKSMPPKLSEIKSIIFKQKLEAWARLSWEFGITPKVSMSVIGE